MDESVTFRVVLHWGARLDVGQIQTAGRSEVTALGDEVNDAAHIEACAWSHPFHRRTCWNA